MAKEAIQCKKQMETLQIQNSPSRTWVGMVLRITLRAYCLADDLSNLKEVMDEVEKMTSISSAWIPTLHYAKGEYHRIRGDHSSAMNELKKGLLLTEPGRHQFWLPLADAYLRTLLALEREEEVRNEARQFLEAAEKENLGYMCNYFKMSLAIAQARLKEFESALKNADAVIDSFEKMGAARINLGMAYETRTKIAILLDDDTGFAHFVRLCADQYRTGGNSCLIAKVEKLIQEARQAELTIPTFSDLAIVQDVDLDMDNIYRDIRERLDQCDDSNECADRALEILADHCEANGGYLLGLQADGLRMLSNNTGDPAPQKLIEVANVYLDAELKDSTEATITVADENAAEGSNPAFELEDGTRVELVLVRSIQQGQPVVVGVAALSPVHSHLLAANPKVVHAISDALLEKGEVTSRIAA